MTGFFSLSETAFASLNKYRLQVEADNGSHSARLALKIHGSFDNTLITVLVGTNLMSVALSFVSTALFIVWLSPSLNDDSAISLIASVVTTVLIYIFGETIPKQIGRKIPNRLAKILVYPLYCFYFILYPISLVFRFITFLSHKIFRQVNEAEMTEEDFTSVIEQNEKSGLLEENESDLIQASFDFTDTSVKEVLTPKDKMFEIDLKGLSNEKLASALCDTNYSRVPLYYEDEDKIVGVVIVKNYLAAYLSNPNLQLKDFIEKPYIVNPKVTMDELIDGFRKMKTQIALVYKDKSLVGMVTMEDVLEELVGPIDEKASLRKEKSVRP